MIFMVIPPQVNSARRSYHPLINRDEIKENILAKR
jgi:hypothetical protein